MVENGPAELQHEEDDHSMEKKLRAAFNAGNFTLLNELSDEEKFRWIAFMRRLRNEKKGLIKQDMIYLEEYYHSNNAKKNILSNYEFRDDLKIFLYETLGVTFEDLLGRDGAFYKQLVNTHYYVQLERIVNEIRRRRDSI